MKDISEDALDRLIKQAELDRVLADYDPQKMIDNLIETMPSKYPNLAGFWIAVWSTFCLLTKPKTIEDASLIAAAVFAQCIQAIEESE
jgi:hypothetical protein